jgi:hypothetical protein
MPVVGAACGSSGGIGIERIAEAMRLERIQTQMLGENLYLTGYPAN